MVDAVCGGVDFGDYWAGVGDLLWCGEEVKHGARDPVLLAGTLFFFSGSLAWHGNGREWEGMGGNGQEGEGGIACGRDGIRCLVWSFSFLFSTSLMGWVIN